jgi:hypothetical protein
MLDFPMLDLHLLAKGLIVCGAAFVCSGLIFLLPRGRTEPQERDFEQDIQEIDERLEQERRDGSRKTFLLSRHAASQRKAAHQSFYRGEPASISEGRSSALPRESGDRRAARRQS